MRHLTITTDFGSPSGAMKGVIWKIAPGTPISDISWNISPQNVIHAAIELDRQVWFYPDESVHVIVVDPGVGTQRRPIAAKIGMQYFVAPDNGVLTALLQRGEKEDWPIKIVHTNKPRYWLPKVSKIFHGRDIFAPVGAHLAAGVPLQDLGDTINDEIRLDLPFPIRTNDKVTGQITMIYEHFGNIITNIHREDVKALGDLDVTLCGVTIEGLVATFGERPAGTLVALFDECDYLYISVVNGSAANQLNPKVGDKVEVMPSK